MPHSVCKPSVELLRVINEVIIIAIVHIHLDISLHLHRLTLVVLVRVLFIIIDAFVFFLFFFFVVIGFKAAETQRPIVLRGLDRKRRRVAEVGRRARTMPQRVGYLDLKHFLFDCHFRLGIILELAV